MEEAHSLSARRLIAEALLALLARSSFDTITVGAIVRKAGVSRSTFYVHYADKFELLEQLTGQILRELEAHYTAEWMEAYREPLAAALSGEEPLPVTVALLEHVRRYQHFYRDRYRDPAFVVRLSELLSARLQTSFRDETYAIFLAYGTVGYIGRWLHGGLQGTPYEVAKRLTNVAKLSQPHIVPPADSPAE